MCGPRPALLRLRLEPRGAAEKSAAVDGADEGHDIHHYPAAQRPGIVQEEG